jgi:hypothetical protein
MNREVSELLEEALALPPEAREALSESLLDSLHAKEPRPADWSYYLTDGPRASDTYMDGVRDLPLQASKRRTAAAEAATRDTTLNRHE